jgi:hypothetical protein
MNCFKLRCICPCGEDAIPQSLCITDQKELLVKTVCVNCEKSGDFFFPLTHLYKSCPSDDLTKKETATDSGTERNDAAESVDAVAFDKKFMKDVGISTPAIKFTAP